MKFFRSLPSKLVHLLFVALDMALGVIVVILGAVIGAAFALAVKLVEACNTPR